LSGGLEQYLACAVFSDRFMRIVVSTRAPDKVFLGIVDTLPDSVGYFCRLSDPAADVAVFIPDYDKRAEAEVSAALDDLGNTSYFNDLFLRSNVPASIRCNFHPPHSNHATVCL
jgi:hypothetical protein